MSIILIIGVFALGLWGVINRRNILKKIIALIILNCAIVLLFVYGGAEIGATAPILSRPQQQAQKLSQEQSQEQSRKRPQEDHAKHPTPSSREEQQPTKRPPQPVDLVDPLPQALMLTNIVVGFCVTALALVIAVKLFRSYGTLDLERIEAAVAADEH